MASSISSRMGWDKELSMKLRQELKLTFEQAQAVVGIVAEERQQADRDGYERGYNDGYDDKSEESEDD